jgi:hypothetical protein
MLVDAYRNSRRRVCDLWRPVHVCYKQIRNAAAVRPSYLTAGLRRAQHLLQGPIRTLCLSVGLGVVRGRLRQVCSYALPEGLPESGGESWIPVRHDLERHAMVPPTHPSERSASCTAVIVVLHASKWHIFVIRSTTTNMQLFPEPDGGRAVIRSIDTEDHGRLGIWRCGFCLPDPPPL